MTTHAGQEECDVNAVAITRRWEVVRRSLIRTLIGACCVAALAGCGSSTSTSQSTSASGAGSDVTVSTPASTDPNAPGVDHATVRFCQKLDNGRWVTNDIAGTQAPCTPQAGSPTDIPNDVEPNCKVGVHGVSGLDSGFLL